MIILQIDDFLRKFDDLKAFEKEAEFSDVENPYDGVVYPLICQHIPRPIIDEIKVKLSEYLGREPYISASFLRRSPEGVHVPHIAHTDKSMGDYSLMLYLSDGEGGTAFLRHAESGMMYQPESTEFIDLAVRDQNKTDKWRVCSMVPRGANRACIFDAGLFHCAMPVGGDGEGDNARTVLTVFFS